VGFARCVTFPNELRLSFVRLSSRSHAARSLRFRYVPLFVIRIAARFYGALFAMIRPTGLGIAGLLSTCLGAACAPMVAQAPFSSGATFDERGDLLGPFDGLVVDAETERPIADALVSAYWAFERGVGLAGPQKGIVVSAKTGADGRYEIPVLDSLETGIATKLARFTLIIYKRGYVAWRSDRVFPKGLPRHDFVQHENRALLVKWPREGSHLQHLIFVGGGKDIRDAAEWERQPASLELAGIDPAAVTGNANVDEGGGDSGAEGVMTLLNASGLLVAEDVRGATGFAGEFEAKRLIDRPRTEFYDSVHLAAKDQDERFDVALRFWRLGSNAAEQQYRSLLAELPDPLGRNEAGDESVRVRDDKARAIVFLLRELGLVGSLTCGLSQCAEPDMLIRLAMLVESRMLELVENGSLVEKQDAAGETAEPEQSQSGAGQSSAGQDGTRQDGTGDSGKSDKGGGPLEDPFGSQGDVTPGTAGEESVSEKADAEPVDSAASESERAESLDAPGESKAAGAATKPVRGEAREHTEGARDNPETETPDSAQIPANKGSSDDALENGSRNAEEPE